MKGNVAGQEPVEVERYELRAGPARRFELDRRDFVKLLGAGLLITVSLPASLWAQRRGGRGGWGSQAAGTLDTRLHIAADGRVTVMTGKVEIGQGIRTSLAQAAAEELRLAPESIRMLMGDTDLVPDDGPTFGSMTTPYTLPLIRQAAAAAREYLIDLAAARWKTARTALVAAGGRVKDPRSGRSLTYGELARGEKLTRKIGEVVLTPADRWQALGKPLPSVDGEAIVTGNYRYPSDVRREGMLYGKVLRPPAAGAKLLSADLAAARALPGVVVVREGDFIGVAAGSAGTAEKALAAIKAQWSVPPQPDDREIYSYLRTHAAGSGGGGEAGWAPAPTEEGSVEEGMGRAAHTLQATYTLAYIAHAPLETHAAVAEWKNGKVTVWTGTQIPFWVRREVAQACGIPESRVRIIMSAVGAAFGGKHTGEAAVEAALLSRRAGRPVRVLWTREEEFTAGYFRPAGVIDVKAGVAADGTLTAWEMHNYNSGAQALSSPWYAAANVKTAFHASHSPLRQGSYRALAAPANHFAREAHLDGLAALIRMDPLAFRLKNLREPRLRAVLESTAERFGWGKTKSSPTRGFGLACGLEKGSCVACCVEVAIERRTGELRLVRLTEGFECGAIVNPHLLRSQVMGCILQGLGGALFEEIRFAQGKILNAAFSSYRLPRFRDIPAVEVLLLDRKDLPPAGGGETPLVALAPAVGNAVFAATGVPLRSLPLRLPGQ